ncbi:MAG: MATE family efflux transporter [Clostridia bacterium]|nr:MATE family efflux transporter [Clostridia bacterium]
MKYGNRNINMVQGPLFTSIIRYTLPIIATGLLQLLFNAADLVVVGQFCGSISVAAVGTTASITSLMINFFIGLSVGVGVAVAQAIGAKEDTQVYRTVHTVLPLVLICGGVLTVLGFAGSQQFLIWMGTPDDVLPLSTVYMQIIFGGVTFSLAYNFLAAILRAAGDTKSPLIFLTIAGVANVVLNVIFVTLFHMNVAGVALATVLSQALSAVLTLRALMRRTDACQLRISESRIYAAPLKRIVQIGLPAGIQSSLFSISNVLIQSSINSFGAVVMSGNAAAQNIDGFIGTAINGFHQAAVNFTGQNVGAKQYDRVRKVLGICLGCGVVTGMLLSAVIYAFGPQLLSIYINDSAEAITYGMIRLTYLGLPYCCCALMDVSTGALRGMGASAAPMLISVLGICGFRVVWIYTIFSIPAFHTLPVLYISYVVSWLVTAAAELIAFVLLYRKQRRAVLRG